MKIADEILKEKELIKKCELLYYFKKREDIFFDNSVILKAEILRIFLEEKKYKGIDISEMLTLCLIYSVKKINSPQEKLRMKLNKKENIEYIKSLGFSERFAKNATNYKEPEQDEEDTRSNYSKLLDIIDQFGGLILHREDRIAFPVEEALDIIEKKNLADSKNKYLYDFVEFIKEKNVSKKSEMGLISEFQVKMNSLNKEDISNATRYIYDLRDKISGEFEDYEIAKDNKYEYIFDDTEK